MKKHLLIIASILTISANAQITGAGVTDIDGNLYGSVIIGTQEWMSENLRVTKYNDGTSIANITDGTTWGNDTQGAWAYYDNDSNNVAEYGKLYNGYVTDSENPRNVCPVGWYVPVRAEFNELISYLGDTAVAGGKLKESGNTHWLSPSAGTNSTGFTALPGGLRSVPTPSVNFNGMGSGGGFWASDFHAGGQGGYWCLYLSHLDDSALVNFSAVEMGLSVRCVKEYTATGLQQEEQFELNSIYPNPTNGDFSVDLDKTYNSVLITITDLTGRLIESKEYNGTKLLNLKIDEPAGMYLMGIETGDQKAVIRLIKE